MATPTPTPPPQPSSGNRLIHVTASSSPSSSSVPQSRNSMEQVWKDILNLAPLSDGSSSTKPSRNKLLYDFIATTKHSSELLFGCNRIPVSSSATVSAQPATLSFSKQSNNSTFLSSFEISKPSTVTCTSNGKKKFQQDVCSCSPSDPRHQRIIKNRESAVRSRARKKAYRNALELKLARLTEENSRLRQQVEETRLRLTNTAKNPKKHSLYRTLTAPF